MKVVTFSDFGPPEVLAVAEVADPEPGPGEVRIDVAAAGVNRADALQRQGRYPPPPGAPTWPGLEVSGVVGAVGDGVTTFAPGDRVCALLPGGGYAERCVVREELALPVPDGLAEVEAAALVEAACTVWSNLRLAGARPGQTLLWHGGSGGVGTLAIQIAAAAGLIVATTARGPERVARCADLGATIAIDYSSEDVERVVTEAGGVDIVVDIIGAPRMAESLAVARVGGTVVVIGLQGGAHADIDLGTLLSKRLTLRGTTLRSRPSAEKAEIVAAVRSEVWPWIPARVRPVVGATFPLERAADAHRAIESGEVFGKIVLEVGVA